jgi:taurine dioxygenase
MAVELAEQAPETIEIKTLAMTIGAEVSGVDLSKPLPGQQVGELRAAFLRWKVLFFRNQPLDHAQQVAFSRQFGECTPAHAVYGHQDDAFPEVYSIDRDRRNKRYKGEDLLTPWSGWHADITPAINPPAISILRGDKMPPYGGDTQFSDMVAAYNALSPNMKEIVDGLRGIHRYQGNAGVNVSKEYVETLNPGPSGNGREGALCQSEFPGEHRRVHADRKRGDVGHAQDPCRAAGLQCPF